MRLPADKHHCEQLLATARRFIQRNFTEVYMKGEEFVQLPAESIIEVSNIKLTITNTNNNKTYLNF